MKKYFFSIIICFISIHLFAQNEDSVFIRRVANEILSNGKAYDNLRDLTKNVGARLAGSPGMVKAEKWGLRVMKESGADKAWLQECMVPHWVRGGQDKAEALYSGSSKKSLYVAALGNSIGSGGKAVSADVIEVTSFNDLESKKDQVKGKIVFYNYHFNPTFVQTFQSYGDAVRYRSAGASRASKYGAVAVIVRSMSHSTDNFPHTGGMNYDTAYPKIPAVAIGLQDADWLNAQLQKSQVKVSLTTYARFLPDTIGHNVIGELTGSEFPNEYITVGGHLDSWDLAEGAHDDGAGVTQTMEILRAFKALGYTPKHSIRFVLFSNEENGLRGGIKYAEEAKAKNEKQIFGLESDAGGFTPRSFSMGGSVAQLEKARSWIPLFLPYGVYQINRGGGGADVSPLTRALGTPTGELSPDSQRYFDYHHAANDVFENVNKRELELGAINMAAFIYLVDKYGL
ncbi:MAG: M20/M25/M40 family metallo-hydrolase [Bacteroidetes bacterium]|nr:M20/M25/M40 family metallo-hydrolase [Bacteroidota bacterium]MBS1631648.1 M20/M25/M40 family metallo-hydrolase [Bacteroidota bacterium]